MTEIVEQLTQLAELKRQGVLTPEEFEQQKGRLLQTTPIAAPTPTPTAGMKPLSGAFGSPAVAAIAFLAVIVLGFGAYSAGLFGGHRAFPVTAALPSSAVPTTRAQLTEGRNPISDTEAPPLPASTDGPVSVPAILAAFKADPVGTAARYNRPMAIQATVLKVNASADTLRVDGGDPNLRVLMDASPNASFDRNLVGDSITADCQKPDYTNVDGEQMLFFDHCTVRNN